MAAADMAKAVHHTLVVKDAVGGNEIVDQSPVCICHVSPRIFPEPSGKRVAAPG
jgi:hypothetical protein